MISLPGIGGRLIRSRQDPGRDVRWREKSQRLMWPRTLAGAGLGWGGPPVQLTEEAVAGGVDPLACPRRVRRRAVPVTGELRRFAQRDPAALVPLDLDDHRCACRCCCCTAAAC